MTTFSALTTVTLIFSLHVAPVWAVTMAAKDKSALMTMREAIVNKNVFPAILCGPLRGDHFQCDASGRLTTMDLSYLGLKGRISAAIGRLTKLNFINFRGNQLSGSIPWSIGDLRSLQTLFLRVNNLTGSIPWSIGQLESIEAIEISSNILSGSFPWSIGNLTSLQSLNLYGNQLSGSIPWSIGNLTSLQYLYLGRNKLSGVIPASMGNLKSLQGVYLHENQLTGKVPSSFRNLTYFQIWNNYITGPVVRVGKNYCYDMRSNCLFGVNLPFGCLASKQKSQSTCLSFCNALQAGGPCGGKGVCSIGTDGKTSTCACNKGYNNEASKFTCT